MRGKTITLLAGLALAGVAHAGEPAQADTNVYFNGIKVAIDPTTGRLRQPTAAEAQALRESAQRMPTATSTTMPKTRADAHRTIRKMRDGSVMAQLSQDMMLSVEATRLPDGSIQIQHAGDSAAHQEAGHE